MEIELPDIKDIISEIIEIEASFNGKNKRIKEWIEEHREEIQKNNQLIEEKSDENDIRILRSILVCLLVRAMKGERGTKIYEELQNSIKTKQDLDEENYKQILKRANYRWGVDSGAKVISEMVNIFRNKLNWEWKTYFSDAEKYYETNFQQDELLKVKNIGFKVRDLALSDFNRNYVANDLHVVRVMTRIGLLNYGFDLLKDEDLEMGNNSSERKNYLFLHKLVLKLSRLTDNEYSPTDLDRIFWFFGKSFCGARPKCSKCPINNICLTGRYKK